jgi:hypothetical protein
MGVKGLSFGWLNSYLYRCGNPNTHENPAQMVINPAGGSVKLKA